ncbi:hypothetical protein GGS20DRAFT_186346 [Poronia punctata]|nr:hypothetical protein GGS20DRAFT_186346 [Poronia punctata]
MTVPVSPAFSHMRLRLPKDDDQGNAFVSSRSSQRVSDTAALSSVPTYCEPHDDDQPLPLPSDQGRPWYPSDLDEEGYAFSEKVARRQASDFRYRSRRLLSPSLSPSEDDHESYAFPHKSISPTRRTKHQRSPGGTTLWFGTRAKAKERAIMIIWIVLFLAIFSWCNPRFNPNGICHAVLSHTYPSLRPSSSNISRPDTVIVPLWIMPHEYLEPLDSISIPDQKTIAPLESSTTITVHCSQCEQCVHPLSKPAKTYPTATPTPHCQRCAHSFSEYVQFFVLPTAENLTDMLANLRARKENTEDYLTLGLLPFSRRLTSEVKKVVGKINSDPLITTLTSLRDQIETLNNIQKEVEISLRDRLWELHNHWSSCNGNRGEDGYKYCHGAFEGMGQMLPVGDKILSPTWSNLILPRNDELLYLFGSTVGCSEWTPIPPLKTWDGSIISLLESITMAFADYITFVENGADRLDKILKVLEREITTSAAITSDGSGPARLERIERRYLVLHSFNLLRESLEISCSYARLGSDVVQQAIEELQHMCTVLYRASYRRWAIDVDRNTREYRDYVGGFVPGERTAEVRMTWPADLDAQAALSSEMMEITLHIARAFSKVEY